MRAGSARSGWPRFLKAHRYPMSKTPAELLARLRAAPAGRAGEVETRTRRQIVLRLTRTLAVMVEQIRELEAEIAAALDAHPDGDIFRSFLPLTRIRHLRRHVAIRDR